MLALVQFTRGTAALGAARYDEAYEQLARIFDPHDTAYHPHLRAWALVDLAEHGGRMLFAMTDMPPNPVYLRPDVRWDEPLLRWK